MASVDQLLPVAPLADEKAKDPERGMQALSVVGPPTEGQEAVSLMHRIEALLPGNTRMKKWITVGLVMAIVLLASALGWKLYASKPKGHCPDGYVEVDSSSGASSDRRLMDKENYNCKEASMVERDQGQNMRPPRQRPSMLTMQAGLTPATVENMNSGRLSVRRPSMMNDQVLFKARQTLQAIQMNQAQTASGLSQANPPSQGQTWSRPSQARPPLQATQPLQAIQLNQATQPLQAGQLNQGQTGSGSSQARPQNVPRLSLGKVKDNMEVLRSSSSSRQAVLGLRIPDDQRPTPRSQERPQVQVQNERPSHLTLSIVTKQDAAMEPVSLQSIAPGSVGRSMSTSNKRVTTSQVESPRVLHRPQGPSTNDNDHEVLSLNNGKVREALQQKNRPNQVKATMEPAFLVRPRSQAKVLVSASKRWTYTQQEGRATSREHVSGQVAPDQKGGPESMRATLDQLQSQREKLEKSLERQPSSRSTFGRQSARQQKVPNERSSYQSVLEMIRQD